MKRLSAFTAVAAVCATQSFAQDINGTIGFTYALPSESGDLDVTEYFGGLEYNINQAFAVGVDLAGYDFEDVDASFVSSTVHFIYHFDNATSFGFFAGGDSISGDAGAGPLDSSALITGVEAGGALGAVEGETYLGFVIPDEGDENATVFGVSGAYAVANGWSAIGSFDRQSLDDYSANVLAVGVEYELAGGPELFGKFGQRSASVDGTDDDSQFIEIGASVSFGGQGGTTFDRRSFFEALPNF